jgi:hypothetical protein
MVFGQRLPFCCRLERGKRRVDAFEHFVVEAFLAAEDKIDDCPRHQSRPFGRNQPALGEAGTSSCGLDLEHPGAVVRERSKTDDSVWFEVFDLGHGWPNFAAVVIDIDCVSAQTQSSQQQHPLALRTPPRHVRQIRH